MAALKKKFFTQKTCNLKKNYFKKNKHAGQLSKHIAE
jgi:hypothetical protein